MPLNPSECISQRTKTVYLGWCWLVNYTTGSMKRKFYWISHEYNGSSCPSPHFFQIIYTLHYVLGYQYHSCQSTFENFWASKEISFGRQDLWNTHQLGCVNIPPIWNVIRTDLIRSAFGVYVTFLSLKTHFCFSKVLQHYTAARMIRYWPMLWQ